MEIWITGIDYLFYHCWCRRCWRHWRQETATTAPTPRTNRVLYNFLSFQCNGNMSSRVVFYSADVMVSSMTTAIAVGASGVAIHQRFSSTPRLITFYSWYDSRYPNHACRRAAMRVERQPRVSQELHLPKRIGQSATYLLFPVILLQTQCNGRHVPLTKPSGYKVCFYQYTVIASLPCPSGIWVKCKIVSRKTAILEMLYCIICIVSWNAQSAIHFPL